MRPGITETVWNKVFNESQRLAWTIVVGLLSIVAGFFVSKTGKFYLDIPLLVYLFINATLIVHVQRKFSVHDPQKRRALARYSVMFFVLGLFFIEFSAALTVLVEVLRRLAPGMKPMFIMFTSISPAIGVLFGVLAATSVLFALWLSFRSSDWHASFVEKPKKFFILYVFGRRLQAVNVKQFFAIELAVVYYTYIFCYFVVHLYNVLRGTTSL